uniref:Nitrogen permease regulator 2 n=1 Tax=Strongyloides papillosus TaxID=174720 RepID=A0A0N5C8Z3_STREA
MKGVLLVDDRDSVIFTNGDNEFLSHIRNYDNIEKMSEGETSSRDEFNLTHKNLFNQFVTIDIPNRQATDVFLPLIMLFNSHRAQQNIIINEIESNNLKFFFRHLSEQHYIIYVTEVDYKVDSKRILDKLHHLFRFYLGPFCMLIRNELSSMRHAKNMLKFRVVEIIEKRRPIFQLSLDHPSYYEDGVKFCKNLSNGLKKDIPNNLCILVRNGRLLASYGTVNSIFSCNHLTDSLSGDDIEEILHICKIRLKYNLNEDIDSVWLKLIKRNGVLSFVNVYFVKITNEISSIMITTLNDSWKIYKINEVFEYMLKLGQAKIIRNYFTSIDEIIYDLFPKNKIDYTLIDHQLYKNHGRRIINIWSKLKKQLLGNVAKTDGEETKKYHNIILDRNNVNNFSKDNDVKSVTTSLASIFNKSKKILMSYFDNLPIHLELLEEVMIAQLKRMFRFYLNDILEINKNDGKLLLLGTIKCEFRYCYATSRKSFFMNKYDDVKIYVDEDSLGYVVCCSNLPIRYCNISNFPKRVMALNEKQIELLLMDYLNIINFNDVDDKEEFIEISEIQNNSFYTIKYSVRDNYINNLYDDNYYYPGLLKFIFPTQNKLESLNVFQVYAIFDFHISKEIAIIQCKDIVRYYFDYISTISKYILV